MHYDPHEALRLTSAGESHLTSNDLTEDEQNLIDRWVESTLDDKPLSPVEVDQFDAFLREIAARDGDLWNSTWPGFHARETIPSHASLEECIDVAFDAGGIPGTTDFEMQDAISEFRAHLDSCWERQPGIGLIEIRDRKAQSAWVGIRLGDWGEIENLWLSPSPVELEAAYRKMGYVFPNRDSIPPSGVVDEFTDDQILNLMTIAAPQKLKEHEEREQKHQAAQEKKRLRREAASARRKAKKS